MSTTMKLLAKQVLSTAAASVSFTSIPGTYSDLLLVSSVRASVATDYFWIRFNGLSTNLSGRSFYGQNGSTVTSITIAPYARMVQSDHTANTFASNSIYIPNYAGSTNKSISADAVYSTNSTLGLIDAVAGLWASTAAITQVDLVPNSGNFAAASSFFLYGISRA